VGSTQAAFAGTYRGQTAAFALDAPRANLADFNDLFDPGDVLGGHGRVKADFRRTAAGVQTRAEVAVTGVEYRRIPLGDLAARWTSAGSRVDGQATFTGLAGRLSAEGSVTFPGRVPLQKLIASSTYDLRATLLGFDLNTWLPVLGYELPLGGRVDAKASLRGRFPALAVSTEAGLSCDGAIGQVAYRWNTPRSDELRRVMVGFQMGRDRRQALRELAQRTGVPELSRFASAVIQADSLGVPLSRVLHEQSDEMRLRRRQRAEELAQKAPVKMLFPMVLLIFPALFVVVLGPAVPRLLSAFSAFN